MGKNIGLNHVSLVAHCTWTARWGILFVLILLDQPGGWHFLGPVLEFIVMLRAKHKHFLNHIQ